MSRAKSQLIECEEAVSEDRQRQRQRWAEKDSAEIQTPEIITLACRFGGRIEIGAFR